MTKPCEERGVPSNIPTQATEQDVWRVGTNQQLAELEKQKSICEISVFRRGAVEAYLSSEMLRCAGH
jgi:hypothetical protein